MSFIAVLTYARGILSRVPWEHWVVMGVLSLALTIILLIRKKCSVYGAIAAGLTVFMGMFLLDTAVAIRYMGIMHHISGYNLTLDFSRLFQKSGQGPAETISNIAVYVPFGFFLGEALAEGERWGGWRLIGKVTLAAFSLSLFIECLQLVLHVGFFELTDLVLNTVGGGVGGCMAAGIKELVKVIKVSQNKRKSADELFQDYGIRDDDRLYVIGNGFDIHHGIKSKYWDFKRWLLQKKENVLIGLMDTFFSNECEFWSDIENALGDYRENEITNYCEPLNSEDFKFDHPGLWQAGVEDSIHSIFGVAMDKFRDTFGDWVNSIDIDGIHADLHLPTSSKYLTFNYTETLERYYFIPDDNVLHIHGNRLKQGDEFIIGHGNQRDCNDPFEEEGHLLPYQNANSSVIEIMNQWTKNPKSIINHYKSFFQSLNHCKAVCVMGLSYNGIDLPYLKEIAGSVADDCKWWLYYHDEKDKVNAANAAMTLGLDDYCLKCF